MLTWGNHKIVGRQPLLGIQSDAWWGDRDNWEPPVHGGPQGTTFWDTSVELCPEVLVIEAEPTGYPRAPVGKKRVYLDVRNMIYVAYVTFDRKGELWKSFEAGWSQRVKGDLVHKDQTGHPVWGPTQVHSYDVQSGRMSRLYLAHHLGNGMKAEYDGPADAYDKYLTVQAIRRLGT
jgi:hypothetical protein